LQYFIVGVIVVTYILMFSAFICLNKVDFLDKMTRSGLSRFEPIKVEGDWRCIKNFFALTLITFLCFVNIKLGVFLLTIVVPIVLYQCYDIFRGLSQARFLVVKKHVSSKANVVGRLDMFLKSKLKE